MIFYVDPPTGDATKDMAAINKAIADANTYYNSHKAEGQVTVQLASGTYMVSGDPTNPSKGPVELMSGVALVGAGTRDSTIKLVDNFNARINGIVRTELETVENVTVANLIIDGNREHNTGHQAGFICGIKEDGSGRKQTNITIDNVEVMNCTAYGINPHEVTYGMTIKNSESHGNGLDGFVADAVVGGTYENNVAYNNDRHGFNIQNETTDLTLKNNEAYGNGYAYMYEGTFAGGAGLTIQRGNIPPKGSTEIPWVSDIEIIGGSYHNNRKEGILVKLSERITITDVDIYGNLRQGVRIEGSTDVTVQGSRIYNNSQELDGKYDEINIRERFDNDYSQNTYYSYYTQIINNQISSTGGVNARYGVREEPENDDLGPTGTYVSGNTISGMNDGDVSVPGYIWTGDANDNVINGGRGADTMAGGMGHDTYTVNHSGDLVNENAGEGSDHVLSSITYTLTHNVEHLTLTGVNTINGYGNELDNQLVGNGAANTLKGNDGTDTLYGGAGNDTLDGGNGDDSYYVDDLVDVIVEKASKDANGNELGGYDRVFSSVTYDLTLLTQVEELTLTGSANLNATGNTKANVLNGNTGDNILDGVGGADTMNGGAGNDIYYVNHSQDQVNEAADAGTDTVISTISVPLPSETTKSLAPNVENLVLIGLAGQGAGNELNNVITGNDQDNKLYGLGGHDTFFGGLGNDTFEGGIGTDTVIFAGKWSDYTLPKSNELKISGSDIGTDTLRDIEILQFADGRFVNGVWEPKPVDPGTPTNPGTPTSPGTPTNPGTPSIPGTPSTPGTPSNPANPAVATESRNGNSKANTLLGNDNINIMKGLGGNDVIKGRGADDKLYGGDGNDKVYGESGDDWLYGDDDNDRVYGGIGDDHAYGGAGNDRVYGESGNDHVYGGGGRDTVYGGSGDDVIDGDGSNDILYGNAGSDAFVFGDKIGTAKTDRTYNYDTIKDFNVTLDSLWLDNAVFRKLGSGTSSNPTQLNKEFFVAGTKAKEKDDYLIYNKKTGVLSYDADGSGSKEAVEFAQLSRNLKLTYKDFFVI